MKHKVEFFLEEEEWLEWKALAGGPLAAFVRAQMRKIIRRGRPSAVPSISNGEMKSVEVRFFMPARLSSIYLNKLQKSGLAPRDFWINKLMQSRSKAGSKVKIGEKLESNFGEIGEKLENHFGDVGEGQILSAGNRRLIEYAIQQMGLIQEHYPNDPLLKSYVSQIALNLKDAIE